MTFDIIDSSYTHIDSNNLVPSFLNWLFSNALNIDNGNIFGSGLIMVVGVVSFFVFKSYRFEKAMITSATITWIVALFALKAGWINNFIFVLSCVYVVVGLYYLFDKSSGEEA